MENTSTASPLTNIGIGQIVPALKIFFEALFHRGELVAAELSQVREYIFYLLVATYLTVVLILLGCFSATFMVAAMVWERPDRGFILGLMAAGYLILATAMGFFTIGWLRKWRPLRETAIQLRTDHECLQSILTSGPEQRNNGHVRT